MLKINGLLIAATFGFMAALPQTAAAGSDAKVYRYATKHHYCPAGLQPVTTDGMISCGTPNRHVSYQHMKAHPVTKKRVHRKVHHSTYHARSHCQIGTKGCTYD